LAPVLVAVASWPPVLYQIVVFLNSTEFRLKALMRTSPPPLWDILLSYGLLIPLACWGAWQWRQRRSTLLLVLWAAVPIAMSYLPLSFGRKMMEGVHLPLCILAAAGLVALAAKLKTPALRRFAVAVVLLVGSISSVYFVGWCLKAVEENNWPRVQGYSMAPFYLTQSDVAALEFLRERPQAEKTVTLSLLMLGNYVPRITGGVAFGGHPAETLHYYDIKTGQGKFTDIKRFFGQRSRMSPAEARRWLRDNRISVIIYGEYEQRFGVTLPFALPVIKEFPGTNDLPGTILFDASAVWPQ
jgi:hypothetical protein